MSPRGTPVALLVSAAFLGGGLTGALVGRRIEPPPGPPGRTASTVVDGSEPPRTPTSASLPPPAQPPPQAPPAPAALGVATLVVTFALELTPGPTDGAVYVLPAGAPGVDDLFTVPHGTVGEPFEVPAPATYDVGILAIGGKHDGEVALATDVHVEAGETRRLEIARAREVSRPIRMHVHPGPTGTLPRGWIVRVRWTPHAAELPKYPGRGESREGRLPITSRFEVHGETDVETEPLPEGGSWSAEAFVEVEDLRDPPEGQLEVPLRAILEPPEARPGARVDLRLEPFTFLRLRAVAPEGGWPEGVGPLRIVWTGEGPPVSVEYETPWALEQGAEVQVSPGRGRLSWSGPGFVSGRSEPIVATPPREGIVLLEPRIELDPTQRPVPSRLFLRVRAGERPIDVDEPATVYRVQRTLREAPADWGELDRSWASDLRIDLPPSSEGETHKIVVVHRSRSSDVLDVRSGADVEVDLHPGGYLILVPGSTAAPPFETTLERVDGGPLPSHRPWVAAGSRAVGRRVSVEAGVVLGPFPAGVLRLRMLRAGVPAGELVPTVRADAYVPLEVPP